MKVWTNTHSIFQQISTSALVLCLASVIIGTWLRLFLFLFLTFTACFYIEKSHKLPVFPYINKTMTFITFIRTQPQPTYQLRTLKTSNSCPLNSTTTCLYMWSLHGSDFYKYNAMIQNTRLSQWTWNSMHEIRKSSKKA